MLHNVCADATPGAASSPSQLDLQVIPEYGPLRRLRRYEINNNAQGLAGVLSSDAALTFGQGTSIHWTGELYLPQRFTLAAQVIWIGNGNLLQMDLFGVLIPYGNFSI